MDHHLHMIVSHPKEIGKIIQNLKSFTAKEIISLLKEDKKNDILNLLKMSKKSYKVDSTYQFWEREIQGLGNEKVVVLGNERTHNNY